MGITAKAYIGDNTDDTTAFLVNEAGMSVKIVPWLLRRGHEFKKHYQPDEHNQFIEAGLAKQKVFRKVKNRVQNIFIIVSIAALLVQGWWLLGRDG